MSYLDDLKWDNGKDIEHLSEAFNIIHTFSEFIFNETGQVNFWGTRGLEVKTMFYMSSVMMDYAEDLKKCIDWMIEEREEKERAA